MASNESIWRSGDLLVVRRGTELPDRCIKTNQPAHNFCFKQVVAWHPPQLYFIIFIGWFVYLLLFLLFQPASQASLFYSLGLMLGSSIPGFFLGLLGYIIVTLFVQKNATVYLGVSEGILRKRRRGIALCWLFGLSMPLLAVCLSPLLDQFQVLNSESGLSLLAPLLVVLPIASMLGALVVGLRIATFVRPDYIDDEYIWLRGVCQEYLDVLPEWNSEQESEEMCV
jgi:hypothetical protein